MEAVGIVFDSITSADRGEDGLWKVVVRMIEKRKFTADGEWEEKFVEAMSIDKSMPSAYSVAMFSATEQLAAEFKTNGCNSLFPDGASVDG